jgi:sulfate adenylyltransferase subunit 1 (EFTu-like GTPase family)
VIITNSIGCRKRRPRDSSGSVKTAVPLIQDSYRRNRNTGSFILIDPGTNETVAAGMIV